MTPLRCNVPAGYGARIVVPDNKEVRMKNFLPAFAATACVAAALMAQGQ